MRPGRPLRSLECIYWEAGSAVTLPLVQGLTRGADGSINATGRWNHTGRPHRAGSPGLRHPHQDLTGAMTFRVRGGEGDVVRSTTPSTISLGPDLGRIDAHALAIGGSPRAS